MSTSDLELPECPLCMEMFEVDDLSFFPCTCGYQICRFCWHRIRTNENGLCPACRKSYPEDPAQFKPLSDDDLQKIRKDWKQKEYMRKQKSAESRKHLTNIRVVQKNLVFVVGLTQRLTDPEVLKRPDYFGKFGRIHKVVINQSTAYIGTQGPSASAYITFYRPEDALSAIRVVNNLQIEGRTLKASLGTTKYCSHFLKGTQCTKNDCMYLHDYGDDCASFTKEEIQQGKHLVYEQKLQEHYSLNANHSSMINTAVEETLNTGCTSNSDCKSQNMANENTSQHSTSVMCNNLKSSENPSFEADHSDEVLSESSQHKLIRKNSVANDPSEGIHSDQSGSTEFDLNSLLQTAENLSLVSPRSTNENPPHCDLLQKSLEGGCDQSMNGQTLFSDSPVYAEQNNHHNRLCNELLRKTLEEENTPQQSQVVEDFYEDGKDDDLGFDPWDVSVRGLADLIENERRPSNSSYQTKVSNENSNFAPVFGSVLPGTHCNEVPHRGPVSHNWFKGFPPGFSSNGYQNTYQSCAPFITSLPMNATGQNPITHSKNTAHDLAAQPLSSNVTYDAYLNNLSRAARQRDMYRLRQQTSCGSARPDEFNMHAWQEGFRALLPNINISFGSEMNSLQQKEQQKEISSGLLWGNGCDLNSAHGENINNFQRQSKLTEKDWCLSSSSMPDLSFDPAIINTGCIESTFAEVPQWRAAGFSNDMTNTDISSHWNPPSRNMTQLPPPGFPVPTVPQISFHKSTYEH